MKKLKLAVLLSVVSFGLRAETVDTIAIEKYRHDFLNGNHKIVDFVMNLYEKYDIVILGERDHRDTTQYSFIKDIVADCRFIDNVGYVYTEVGCNTATKSANDLIKSKFNSEEEFRLAAIKHLRVEDWWPLWEKWNRYKLLRDLSVINDSLSAERKLTIGLTDVNYPWNDIGSPADFKCLYEEAQWNRDYIMSQNFSYMYFHQRPRNGKRKALLVTNAPHAINNPLTKNEGWFIKQGFGDRVAIVLMNWDKWWQDEYELWDDGRVDAAFYMTGNKPVALKMDECAIGDLMMEGLHFKDVADAVVFDVPVDRFVCKCGLDGLITTDFEEEILRRDRIVGEAIYPDRKPSSIEGLYKEYNRERCFSPYSDTVLHQFRRFIEDR